MLTCSMRNTTNQHQSQSLFRVYTFNYEAICVIVQVQVVKTTQHTTSSFLCSSLQAHNFGMKTSSAIGDPLWC